MHVGFSSPMVEPLLAWYAQSHRDLPWRRDASPYHVWVSEIMLQQTRVEAVKRYYERWMTALPTIASLAQTSEQVYLKLWEGLGYYSRVRNLYKAAKLVCEEYGGDLPSSYEQLITLPGIGDYTAGAIASIAFGQPVPAIDGNVLRVATRMDNDETPITQPAYKKALRQRMMDFMPQHASGNFNQALMELGAMVCIPNGAPKCETCPVLHLCLAQQHKTFHYLPVKERKKARRIEMRTVLLLRQAGNVGIEKRPQKGLLGGLWQFPSIEGHINTHVLRQALTQQGLHVQEIYSLAPAKHIFTHIEWHMIAYEVHVIGERRDTIFLPFSTIQSSYSIPSAFKAYLQILENEAHIT